MNSNNAELVAVWAKLEPGIDRVLNRWEEGYNPREYMELYTETYNYCTNTRIASNLSDQRSDQKGANLLGGDLYAELRRHLEIHLQRITEQGSSLMDDALLAYYTKTWSKFTTSSSTLNHVFAYLNRHWVKREIDEGHKTIYEIYIVAYLHFIDLAGYCPCLLLTDSRSTFLLLFGYAIQLALVSWREHLFVRLQERVVKAALKSITKQRNGETIDGGLIKTVVESYVSIGLDENDTRKTTLDVYKTYFEQPFIEATESYYKAESANFISANPITEYMKKAEARLQEEERRVEMYLNPSTQKVLISTCETVLVKNHTSAIQDEFQTLLDNDRLEDLSRMYGLLCRVPEGLDRLRTMFEAHVHMQGKSAVEKVCESAAAAAAAGISTNKEGEEGEEEEEAPKKKPAPSSAAKKTGAAAEVDIDPKMYVDALLVVHKKYLGLVQECFRSDTGFNASLDKACREFINRNAVCKTATSKTPELLARYCDSLLRKSSKMAEYNEFEELLNSVMTVFKYVEDKDVFQKFYSKHLAKRLVNQTSTSDDGETSMLTKLKDACGHEYTSKLQRMFTDMGVSKDLNDAFREQSAISQDKETLIDFATLVLNTACWPFQAPKSGLNIPDDLLRTYERFQRFYQAKHQGRKLTWLFQFCKGELKTNYAKSSKTGYTFQVSTYQMAALLLYNTDTTYTLRQLLDTTGISQETLVPSIAILVKAKILVIEDGGSITSETTRFTLNEDFKSKKVRINLNLPIKTEQKAESEDTHRTIEDDRKILIQAAIVRVMKTRKTLKHVTLLTEVIQQLQSRFKPQPADIKKCIDILLEKEYIERREGEKDMYNYLA
eukprot:jgi/Hompol1/3666/HPOL_003315-RA